MAVQNKAAWTCVVLAWERCTCSAGLGATGAGNQRTLSWGWRGKLGQKNYYFVCCLVLVKEGEERGRKRGGKWGESAFFRLLWWHWVLNHPGYISVITVSTGEPHNSYSAVPVSSGEIHLAVHQHLHLSCLFTMEEKGHFLPEKDQRTVLWMCSLFPSTIKPDLGEWQLRSGCLQWSLLEGNKISPTKLARESWGTVKETPAIPAFSRDWLSVIAAITWPFFFFF